MRHLQFKTNIYLATIYQFAIALVALWLTRLAFYAYNSDMTGSAPAGELWNLMWHGLRFDLTAAIYVNALFIVMRFLPWRGTSGRIYLRVSDWIYYVTNTVMIAVNIADIPFFRFSGSRMRWFSLVNMSGESNIVGVILSYFKEYWWAFCGVALIMAVIILLYHCVTIIPPKPPRSKARDIVARCGIFLLAVSLSFLGIRGSVSPGRPFGIGDAAQYVKRNGHINVVLNTPFCILRSLSGTDESNTVEEVSLLTDDEIARVRTSIQLPDTTATAKGLKGKNVVVIVMESGGQHFIDTLNFVHGDTRRGLMPFLDSIATKSLTVLHNMATGRRSNEGIMSIFGGFPNYEPLQYMLSPYNANTFDSPARLLRDEGYTTRFYFGGNRGSFNIDQILGATGFSTIIDRRRYDNEDDYDGTWGIWDHAMGAYAARDMSTLPEPFMAGWFTLDAHAPFNVPDDWNTDGYLSPAGGQLRAIEYTDRAIRNFFETARTQPWYDNTVFIITSDHGCRDLRGTKYDTPYILYHIPYIVYAPDGSIEPRRIDDRVMSQLDIAPSILGLLGYDKPFMSPGTDILDDSVPHYAASFIISEFQVTGMKYAVRMGRDLRQVTAVYDITTDQQMTTPLTDYDRDEVDRMVTWLRALVQEWNSRIVHNRMSVETAGLPTPTNPHPSNISQ
ncbi:MAG: sulfatase-like hydrolase/transferase [Pseudoflavonifractor sp.]|nr:sulfatase-like hydrolase/transferase [Pseudoflavonifractor sp.]